MKLATLMLPLAVLGLVAAAQAQAPAIDNGTIVRHEASGPLAREFAAIGRDVARPMWIGYAVPARQRGGFNGCWDGGRGRRVVPIKLEGAAEFFVLYRLEQGMVGRIQIASPECPLDLGGLTLHWFSNVTAAASLDWLATFTAATDARRGVTSSAVTAIALHGDDSVVERLIALARDGRDRQVRSSALFWLSQRAGERAAGTIADAIENDPDADVKRQAVFALSQLPRDQSVPRLIDLARSNRNAAVRKQAMFWLGQSQDPRALAFFEEVLGGR